MDTVQDCTLVAFGDSITLARRQPEARRWVTELGVLLESSFQCFSFKIINAGVGGNTTREGLQRIRSDVLAHKPDYVLVEFGGNDASADPDKHVSTHEFNANLNAIRNLITAETSARIVMLTFPPIIDEWHAWGNRGPDREGSGPDACVELYRDITRRFAADHELILVDIDKAVRSGISLHGPERYVLPDGVHLTEDGNEIVARAVFEALLPVIQASI